MPQANGFPSGGYNGYTNYTAMQQDALRRVGRMQNRARQAMNMGYIDVSPQENRAVQETFRAENNMHGTQHTAFFDRLPDNISRNENQIPHGEGNENTCEEPQSANIPTVNQSPAKTGSVGRDPLKALAGLMSGDTGEQLFLILLIYILMREKSDPCLIAALIYLLL